MENILKHKDIKLVTNAKDYLKAVMKPNFKSIVLFCENLMGCEMDKPKVVMNKPVYLGQAILDLSKTVMYEFHNDYMLLKYGDNLKLCYMDTDSFIYDIRTEDFYADIVDDMLERFDTSGYDKDDARPLPIGKNKKVIGKMRDELGGKIMTKFVVLRPKSYAYNSEEEKKCKGIKKCIVKKTLGFDDYVNCLLSGTNDCRLQLMFRSTKHEVYMVKVTKVALNRYNDKKIVKKDGVGMLASGHEYLCWNPLLRQIVL